MNAEIFFIAILLVAANLLGQVWELRDKRFTSSLRSFSAGVATAYVFAILLPELLGFSNEPASRVFLPVLLGFTFFHVVRKYIALSTSKSKKLWNERIHILTGVLASFGTSYVALQVLSVDTKAGLIITAALITHTLLSDVVGVHMTQEARAERMVWLFLDASMPIIAAAIVLSGTAIPVFQEVVFGLTIGFIMYISLHEEIPQINTKSRPIFFAVGVLVLLLLVSSII